jgi:aryl-alcohol dehydrogenase-like predicted oxidoreductase
MKTKQLGNSDLFITPVGFGAWAIGGSGWEFGRGEQDDKASVAAIHRALDLGVNWIDTAAVYGMGHSEEVVAFALRTWPGPRPYRSMVSSGARHAMQLRVTKTIIILP